MVAHHLGDPRVAPQGPPPAHPGRSRSGPQRSTSSRDSADFSRRRAAGSGSPRRLASSASGQGSLGEQVEEVQIDTGREDLGIDEPGDTGRRGPGRAAGQWGGSAETRRPSAGSAARPGADYADRASGDAGSGGARAGPLDRRGSRSALGDHRPATFTRRAARVPPAGCAGTRRRSGPGGRARPGRAGPHRWRWPPGP